MRGEELSRTNVSLQPTGSRPGDPVVLLLLLHGSNITSSRKSLPYFFVSHLTMFSLKSETHHFHFSTIVHQHGWLRRKHSMKDC